MKTTNKLQTRSSTLLVVLLFLLLATACGTLEVNVEPTVDPASLTASPEKEGGEVAAEITTEPGSLSPTEAVITPSPDISTPTPTGAISITGTIMRLDPPSGWTEIFSDVETPYANADGVVKVQFNQWSRLANADGSLALIENLSKGAQLELSATVKDGALIVDRAVILSPGVPPPDQNPAYTNVTGQVTPLPETPPTTSGAIQLFEASSGGNPVDPGATITLSWAYQGEQGTICERYNPEPLSDTCFQDLPASGSLDVVIPGEARGTVGYTLFVQAGEQFENSMILVPLTVDQGCQYQWFFNLAYTPLLECPNSAPVSIRPQAQTFERGLMLRLENSWLGQGAYLVAAVNEGGDYSLAENPVEDIWTQGMPETLPGTVPPEGLFAPSRGFGLFWKGLIEIPSLGEARTFNGEAVIGWATGPVFEYDAVYQCRSGTHGRATTCFLSTPDQSVVNLPGKP